MTNTATEDGVLGEITLTITDKGIFADTEFGFRDLMFWLDAAHHQFLKQMFEYEPPVQPESAEV